MGHGPQTSPKRYVIDLFEKSMHIIVTYLSKILSKWRFPEGGKGDVRPPYTNRFKKRQYLTIFLDKKLSTL